MKTKLAILMVVLLAVTVTTVYAGNERRIGTAGAQELLIPIGSRGAAMGGAIMANAEGVEAMYYNPAGLAFMEGTEAMFTHLPYIADIDVNYFAVGTYIEGFGNLGFGAKVVSIGDIEETTVEEPDGTGRFFDPTMTVLNLTYARLLTAQVSFGVTAMLINENILEAQATGMAFDVGFMYDPRWHGLSLGLSIKNYGPEMEFDGIGFDRTVENRPQSGNPLAFELPSSINIGLGWNFVNDGPHSSLVTGNFRSNNFSQDMFQGGWEYTYDQKYSLRAGYNFSDQDEWLYGVSLGAGLKVNIQNFDVSFEYSWTETDVFDDNQFFTVKAAFF